MKEFIEIPFGVKDSKLGGWEYTIPEGYTASIENGKIIVKKEESEDERMRNVAINACKYMIDNFENSTKQYEDAIAWLEKQGDIDRRIQEEIEKQTKQQWNAEKQGEQKPTWSEEDKGNLLDVKCIIDKVWHSKDFREDTYYSAEELESLWSWLDDIWQRLEYPQDTWKPSESDILLLERIANGKSNPQDFQASLSGLIEQLKKLKA